MGTPDRLHENQQGVELSAVEWLLDHFRAKETDRRRMVDELDVGPSDQVLDAGCGPGMWTRLFAEKVASGGGKVTGLDFASDILDYARASFDGDPLGSAVEFVRGDLHEVPFPPETFDLTFLGNCLCYIRDAYDVLEKHKKVTRSGGRMVSKEFDGSAMIFHPVSPVLTLKVVTAAAQALEENAASAWFDNFIGRRTYGMFRDLGLNDVWTRSYAIQKVAPLTEEAKRYIIGNATWYGRTAAPYLSEDERQEWAESFDPESERYVLDRDDFYFCMIETMTVGTV
ncbi:methyltransferase domain-containing protein [Phytoactinopolyspora halotolerans]|uniref:Methyltransferase domain-containing protein n=1 Tax=Phytoactinopolyspora halotolerans TaxID=1981512 RepID=A0A6L9SEW1_9ACTN|nr:methyltransferase domain-containing protein [Phytoactinopolyspora halotolerans]NEE02992.1 methyltransferase domain-containing protein [Phytoactinopolyspora halotolerans]